MPLISRRDLISAGVAASATVLLPHELFSSSGKLTNSAVESVLLSASGQVEQPANSPYPAGKQAEILDLARHTLTNLFAGKTLLELQSDADQLGIPSAERVNITLRCAGRIRGSMSAPGANLGTQVVESVYHVAMDRRYGGPLTRWEMPDAILEVWIQIGASGISRDARLEKNILLLGIEGLEIEGRGRLAYYKPSVAITSKYKTDVAFFQALCKKAGLDRDAWQQPDVSLRRTQWLCLPSVSNAYFFGLTPNAEAKFPIALNTCIEESANFLIRNQNATGCTGYLYDPIADVFVTKKTNLVRSAGCLFALSQILQSNHRIASDEAFKTSTVQMARGLLNLTSLAADGRRILQEEAGKISEEERAEELPEDEEMAGKLPDEDERAGELPPVGATALLTAALSDGILQREFPQEYKQLYRSIVSAQKPDGRFVTHFGETVESERAANYYSGESLLVLALEAERGNKGALEMCRRAFQPYALLFRTTPTSAFAGWHIDVWSRIALLTGERTYADFVFEQTDWLLKLQIKSHQDVRWVGGFSQSGAAPQFSTIVFMEAAVRSLKLAIKTGDAERTTRYTDCIRLGLRFCKQLRLEETQATLLANPLRCKGGVALDLIDRRVRCDAVQHFITLCLAAEEIKENLF